MIIHSYVIKSVLGFATLKNGSRIRTKDFNYFLCIQQNQSICCQLNDWRIYAFSVVASLNH